jgi:hypothetical protein
MGGLLYHFFRALFVDSSIPRLLRALRFSRPFHAESAWRAFMNHVGDQVRPDYLRMNLFVEGEESALDDVDKMPDLRRQVQSQPNLYNDCLTAARNLWAGQFFFELDEEPTYYQGAFRCHGAILCRSLSPFWLVHHLQSEFPTARFMLENTVLGNLSTQNCCSSCGFFRFDVAFDICHRDESVHIFLVFNKLFKRKANGFPHSMSWFGEQQELASVFGRTDHRPKLGPRKCSCLSAAGKRKRKVHFLDETPKKRRG